MIIVARQLCVAAGKTSRVVMAQDIASNTRAVVSAYRD
jgi:hypothetical protein